MRKSRLALRTFAVLLAVVVLAVGGMALSSALAMRRLYIDATLAALGQAALALSNDPVFAAAMADRDMVTADRSSEMLAAGTKLRVTIIAPDGQVLGDSMSDPRTMENHGSRLEIIGALRGGTGTIMRRSSTLGIEMAYAAAPIRAGENVVGVVRVAMGMPDIASALGPFMEMAAAVGLAMIVVMGVASAKFGKLVTEPIDALIDAASDWSAGRLDRRLKRYKDPELALLSDTMNAMASDLAGRIVAMARNQRELGAILDSMDEAVLSTDADLVVRLANTKAYDALCRDGDKDRFVGLTVLQATGNVALDELSRRCAASGNREEAEITLYGDGMRKFLVRAAPLALENGRAGAVLVLDDISRLQRLERVRKDFVANVSHELRTPITLIKGFAETLEAVSDPVEARRFLAIIRRHSDRMALIIEDLLTLARLESPERGNLETSRVDASFVLSRAIESLGDNATAKGIDIGTKVDGDLAANANEGLLEQALVNLLDNAVKYSPRGSSIRVEASLDAGSVRFAIIDNGPGIPSRDLPRLFERFYRVDKARSRELGGTGLGLAIVRHIALAHGGDVSVDSREGAGSTFTLRIPLWLDGEASVQNASPESDILTASS
jgi:two-component system, OmpR family, phosphate regulon sensor histidine kinase PhoR